MKHPILWNGHYYIFTLGLWCLALLLPAAYLWLFAAALVPGLACAACWLLSALAIVGLGGVVVGWIWALLPA